MRINSEYFREWLHSTHFLRELFGQLFLLWKYFCRKIPLPIREKTLEKVLKFGNNLSPLGFEAIRRKKDLQRLQEDKQEEEEKEDEEKRKRRKTRRTKEKEKNNTNVKNKTTDLLYLI